MNSNLEDESGETQKTGEAGAREGDRLAGTGGLDGLAGGGLGRGDGADAGRGRGLGRDGGDGAVVVVRRAGAGAVNTLLVITALINDINTREVYQEEQMTEAMVVMGLWMVQGLQSVMVRVVASVTV